MQLCIPQDGEDSKCTNDCISRWVVKGCPTVLKQSRNQKPAGITWPITWPPASRPWTMIPSTPASLALAASSRLPTCSDINKNHETINHNNVNKLTNWSSHISMNRQYSLQWTQPKNKCYCPPTKFSLPKFGTAFSSNRQIGCPMLAHFWQENEVWNKQEEKLAKFGQLSIAEQ